MANILILQEASGRYQAIRKSLQDNHTLLFAENSQDALALLDEQPIDLIISRVHLERSNVFEFIRAVKMNPKHKNIRFVCFSATRSQLAKVLDATLAHATAVMGADQYLSLDQFCVDGVCNYQAIRNTIETLLKTTVK